MGIECIFIQQSIQNILFLFALLQTFKTPCFLILNHLASKRELVCIRSNIYCNIIQRTHTKTIKYFIFILFSLYMTCFFNSTNVFVHNVPNNYLTYTLGLQQYLSHFCYQHHNQRYDLYITQHKILTFVTDQTWKEPFIFSYFSSLCCS